MSWLYSRALVEEFLEEKSLDGEQYALSSTNPTPQAYLSPDKMTDFSRLSRYGMTFEALTDDVGEDVLMWCLAVFPVRTSAQQDEEKESRESAADSGLSSLASLARYDPDTHSLKTPQCSLFEDLSESSPTLPRWGLMLDGVCRELPMSARPTFERGFGLLPTIRASDGERGGRGDLIQAVRGNPNSHYRLWHTPTCDDSINRVAGGYNSRGEPKLSAQVLMYPTPTASSGGSNKSASPGAVVRPTLDTMARKNLWRTPRTTGLDGGSNSRKAAKARGRWPTPRANDAEKRGNVDTENQRNGLVGAVQKFPTPQSRDWKGSSGRSLKGKECDLPTVAGGRLNADWVEWLMGWPIGWTRLGPIELREESWDEEPVDIPRTTENRTARADRLKAIGNGQVPQCAAEAWRQLSQMEM